MQIGESYLTTQIEVTVSGKEFIFSRISIEISESISESHRLNRFFSFVSTEFSENDSNNYFKRSISKFFSSKLCFYELLEGKSKTVTCYSVYKQPYCSFLMMFVNLPKLWARISYFRN